jgi:MFS superfamily sulfate permease-like transporter
MAAGDTDRAVALAAALAIGAGLGLLAAGLLRLGWAAEFLSRSIVTGFVFGLVLVIIIGEIPKLFGLPPVSGNSIEQSIQLVRSITQLDTPTTLLESRRTGGALPGSQIRAPGPVGAGGAHCGHRDLLRRGSSPTVGSSWWARFPRVCRQSDCPASSSTTSPRSCSAGSPWRWWDWPRAQCRPPVRRQGGYSIDSNQELVGSGAANIAAGISGGLGVAGSLSKTAASRRSGGQTQVTGLVTAIIVLVVLVLLAELLAPLPRTVLSAIVIQAVWGLMDTAALKRYRWIRRNDFISAIAAMIGVLLFGPLYGLLIAIGQALLGLVYRFSRIDLDVMGRVPDEKAAWGSIRNHPERRTYDGIVVVRLDAPLFWANASDACDGVLARVQEAGDDVRAVLLDLEATTQLDTTSIDALELLLQRLQDRGIDLYLVRVFYQARQTLARAEFIERLGEERMWHSISAGVRAARKAAELHGRAHPQWATVSDDDEADASADVSGAAERIAVERNCLGGYEDPDREDHAPVRRRLWWPWN